MGQRAPFAVLSLFQESFHFESPFLLIALSRPQAAPAKGPTVQYGGNCWRFHGVEGDSGVHHSELLQLQVAIVTIVTIAPNVTGTCSKALVRLSETFATIFVLRGHKVGSKSYVTAAELVQKKKQTVHLHTIADNAFIPESKSLCNKCLQQKQPINPNGYLWPAVAKTSNHS